MCYSNTIHSGGLPDAVHGFQRPLKTAAFYCLVSKAFFKSYWFEMKTKHRPTKSIKNM